MEVNKQILPTRYLDPMTLSKQKEQSKTLDKNGRGKSKREMIHSRLDESGDVVQVAYANSLYLSVPVGG